MPTYIYGCDKCNHEWEVFVTKVLTPNVAPPCPSCQSGFTTPRIGASRVHFRHTDKEVRIPSLPKKVYIRRDD